jgi:cytochrome c2
MRLTITVSLAAVLFLAATAGRADPAAGEKLFADNKCNDCHYTQGPAREKSIDDQLAKKGPELWYAGSKFQQPWLQAWLADPQPIRPLKFNTFDEDNPGDHPRLAAAEAGAMTDYLMTLTSADVKAGAAGKGKKIKGKLIFMKRMPCKGCHQYPKKKEFLGGRSGPSLVGASARLNPDWIYAYMMQPEIFKPVKMMPVFAGILKENDVKNVVTFIGSFK